MMSPSLRQCRPVLLSTVLVVGLQSACQPTVPEGVSDDPASAASTGGESLASWNDGASRTAILEFVESVTTPGSSDFVEPEDRIAVFDNDGTLWGEQPLYFQALFAMDRVRALAADRPDLADDELFRAVVDGDQERLGAMSHEDIFRLIALTHGELTTDEFQATVAEWLETARHPRFDVRYDEMVYAPMVELLDYLHANDFRVFIVSGGGIDFMRVFAERAYGIVPERVIGSSTTARFEMRDGTPLVVKNPDIGSLNDGPVKPVNIALHIGRRPILAGGNSDGDLQMLQYTDDGDGPALVLLVHHDDPDREWAYDRESGIGRLDAALDEAGRRGWTVISMRDEFARVFAFE